uniref:UDP-galactose transporter n=2 Tax=Lotharella oceanica TaxID=641309 RepID=A0A7S2TLR9_9EUKA
MSDRIKRIGASVALTGFVVAQTVMIRFSRGDDGKLPYNPAAATFLNELIKLIVSLALWWAYDKDSEYNGLAGVNAFTFCMFSIPGLIYALQNTLVFYALVFLEAPTFQVFASLKIVTTAILFRVALRRILTVVQWVALAQLFLSMVITKMGALLKDSHRQQRESLLYGAAILLFNSWLSAISGIFNEWLVKHQDSKAPLMIKSIQLYAWGTLLNMVTWIATDANVLKFEGITPLVWCIILNNAAVGLSVAFIMKYADNIVKCFSTAAAVFISAVLSSFLFKFPLDLPFMVGLFVYSTAFFLYFGNHNPILRKEGLDDAQALPCVLAERLLGCALEEEDAGNEAKTTKEQRQGDGDGTAVMELGELLDDEGTNVAVTTKNDRKVKAR